MDIPQTHILHAARYAVKPRCERDNVELPELAIRSHDAILPHFNNRVLFDVHNVVLGLVQLLIVILLERWTLGAPGVGRLQGSEDVSLLWILDTRARLLGPEVVRLVIGFLVE